MSTRITTSAGRDDRSDPSPPDSHPTINPINKVNPISSTKGSPRIPDDILPLICAELDNMKSRSPTEIRATPADKVIQRTLLSIQTVSKAGWRAATPYIWHTLRFKNDDDYLSFFAPIRRLLKQTTATDRHSRLHEATSFLKDDSSRQDLHRFFQSVEWIRSIVLDEAPSLELYDDIDLAGRVAVPIFRKTPHFLGEGVTLHLDGVCATMGEADWPAVKIQVLRLFLASSLHGNIEIWNLPGPDDWTLSKFWNNYYLFRGRLDENSPLVIHNIRPDRLADIPYSRHRYLTIWLHPDWNQLHPAQTSTGDNPLAWNMGYYIYDVLYSKYDIRRLAVWGWLGCSCLCNASIWPNHNAKGIIGEISDHARAHFERNGTASGAANDMIKAFLDAGRLVICPTPCTAYDGWTSRDSESNATAPVLDLLTSLPDVRTDG